MAYVLVLLLAAAAGAAVGVATLRTGGVTLSRPGTWTASEVETPAPAAHVPVGAGEPIASAGGRRSLPTDPTWQTRIVGVLGLLVACLVGAGLIVAIFYAMFLVAKKAFGG